MIMEEANKSELSSEALSILRRAFIKVLVFSKKQSVQNGLYDIMLKAMQMDSYKNMKSDTEHIYSIMPS